MEQTAHQALCLVGKSTAKRHTKFSLLFSIIKRRDKKLEKIRNGTNYSLIFKFSLMTGLTTLKLLFSMSNFPGDGKKTTTKNPSSFILQIQRSCFETLKQASH